MSKQCPLSSPLRILLVRDPFDEQFDDVDAIRASLADAGYDLVQIADADIDLPRTIRLTQPDLLIVASNTAARDLIEHVCVSTQNAPRPIIMFTGNTDAERIRYSVSIGVTAYIVDGLQPTRVKSVLDIALARFHFEQQLRNELEDARSKLAERKQIERAKGLLMLQLQLTEDESYRRLRKLSMEKNIRIADAAKMIIDIAAALG